MLDKVIPTWLLNKGIECVPHDRCVYHLRYILFIKGHLILEVTKVKFFSCHFLSLSTLYGIPIKG